MPISKNSPTIRQRRFARILRDLRTSAGLKHTDAAEALACTPSKLTRLENAQSGIRVVDLRILLDLYGVTDPKRREEIEAMARGASQKGWWNRVGDPDYAAYIAVEQDASELYNVETSLIPGLLQTPAYTEAVIRLLVPDATDEHISTQVKVRTERRKVLSRATPLHLWVVLAESVLYHQVASPKVMAEQWEFLLAASRETNIELQILRRESPLNACLSGPFVIMSFPEAADSDIVYTVSNRSTVYYEEAPDVEEYTTLFRRLNMAAENLDRSRDLIYKALDRDGAQ
ncbi:helix-turn-helix domain-containing protein [Streptomyces abikoensis]|uniref:helix-turn-helix domain-containing protein n=1 Tax=Streptomyces abikoensis TaxID=97398 RepID=UPI00368A1FF1